MPCDICQHTMQNVGAEGQRIFWCPRCGTLKAVNGEHHYSTPPNLVGYIRQAEDQSIRTSVDGKTIQYAIHEQWWSAACKCVGVTVHDSYQQRKKALEELASESQALGLYAGSETTTSESRRQGDYDHGIKHNHSAGSYSCPVCEGWEEDGRQGDDDKAASADRETR